VLFGQNQLAEKIERFPELKSRMYPAALTAFNRQDTATMIAFRWTVAGGRTPPFPEPVLDDIFRVTLGMPRDIVKLCDLALLRAATTKRTTTSHEDIAVAARELRLAKEADGHLR
jgi:type II secretory pathway predicted ATPase ExeA